MEINHKGQNYLSVPTISTVPSYDVHNRLICLCWITNLYLLVNACWQCLILSSIFESTRRFHVNLSTENKTANNLKMENFLCFHRTISKRQVFCLPEIGENLGLREEG